MRTRFFLAPTTIALFAFVAFAPGCGSSADVGDDNGGPGNDSGNGDTEPINPTCTPSVSYDPKAVNFAELRSTTPLKLSVILADAGTTKKVHPVKIVLLNGTAEVKTLLDSPSAESLSSDGKTLGAISIDFLASSLTAPAPGKYTLRATLSCPSDVTGVQPASQDTSLFVARIGARAVAVDKGDGTKVPLMYHAVDHVLRNYYPIPDTAPAADMVLPTGEPELDDKTGVARTFPDLWTDLETPQTDATGAVMEKGTTHPISLVLGTKPDLTFTMGKTTAAADPTSAPLSAGLDLPGLPVLRIVVDSGAKVTGDGTIGADGTTTFHFSESPVTAIDQQDVTLQWHFEVQGPSANWVALPGATQTAKFRLYGVLGNTQGTASPQLPWVAVVDEATKKIAGKATDADGARSILVQHVYQEMGLTYDRKSGASAYTYSTAPDGFTNDVFTLASFLKRNYGNVVNCSDCGSILSTYANMIGASTHYCIIGWSFSLNPIEGIGATTFGSPFDSGRMAFSYHAVTSPDSAAHIWDATLAVDGDSDPTTAPYTQELVQGMPGDEYLHRLSPGTPAYQYVDQKTSVK